MISQGIDWQVVYLGVTIVSLIAVSGLAAVGWRFRHADGARHFLFLMLAALGWSALVLIMAIAPVSQTLFWLRIKYLFIGLAPIGICLYALKLTGLMPRRQSPLIAALLVLPVLAQVVLWSPGLMQWMLIEVRAERIGILSHISRIAFGPLYWLWFLQGYALILVSVVILVVTGVRANPVERGQRLMLALGALAPLVTNFLLVTGIAPREYDPMPFGVTVMGYLVWSAVMRYRMVDLVPLARHRLVDAMANAVLATDGEGRVIDCNAPMARLLRAAPATMLGKPLAPVFARLRAQQPERDGLDALERICLPPGDPPPQELPRGLLVQLDGRHYASDAVELPVASAGGRSGRLLILNDVTERIEAENQLARSLAEVRTLRGLLPMCPCCKKIRDRTDRWRPVDEFIYENSEADLTHTICPSCATERYAGLGDPPASTLTPTHS